MGLGLVIALSPGCGPKEDGIEETGESGPDSETGTTTDDSTTSDSATSGTDGPGSTTGTPVDVPARGIQVDWVEANQGIGVAIGAEGGEVPPQDRTAYLLQNRIALIRAFWKLDPDFEPREIEARLHLYFPDGTTETLIDSKTVEGDSFIGKLSQSFYWGVTAEQAVPGLQYRVELFETDPSYAEQPEPDPLPNLPVDGSKAFVGVENSYQILKIVLVPFNYDDGANCVTSPDTSEETMQLFYDYMYMMNPVDRVDIEMHEPVDWNEPLSNFGELNSFMSQMRFDEGAAPEVYYYGLVDVCSGGLGGAGGQAYGIPSDPTSMDAAYQRVSSGLSLPDNPEWSAETFVHEVGHSQGRRHVACNGQEGGPDPTYPIEGGDVGEWGFGVIDFALRHPTVHKDYMTYCHPVWVSTWGWNKVYPTIRALSMWDPDYPGGGAPLPDDPYQGSLLVGYIPAQGEPIWHTVPGTLSSTPDARTVEARFTVADQSIADTTGQVTELPDTEGDTMITVPLPTGFDAVDRIALKLDDQRLELDRSRIRLGHHARNLAR